MKTKTIKSILGKKHKDFCKSITDESVRALVEKNSYITGGCIVSMLQQEDPNDYDYYFKDVETAAAVAGYFVTIYNENHKKQLSVKVCETAGVKILGMRNSGYEEVLPTEEEVETPVTEEQAKTRKLYQPKFLSDNAITLSDKVQLIFRFTGTIEEIHENFDFIHCTCSWDSGTKELTLPNEALIAVITKELVFMNSKYPLCAMIRTRKFINRGWSINAAQYVKIALLLNPMDLLDPKVLEDQLTGVDSAYFMAVIREIGQKQHENPDFHIDNYYLFTVLDKIFN